MPLQILSFISGLVFGIISTILRLKAIRKKKIDVINSYSVSAKEVVSHHVGNLKLSYDNKIYENISAFEYIIFNSGTDGIDGEDIAKDNPIVFGTDENSELLDLQVVSESCDGIKTVLEHISPQSVAVKFQWLFKKSGTRIKFLCSGESPILTLSGKIKGLPPLGKIAPLGYQGLYSALNNSLASGASGDKTPIFLLLFTFLIASLGSIRSCEIIKTKAAYIYSPVAVVNELDQLRSALLVNKPKPVDTTYALLSDSLRISNINIKFDWEPNVFARAIGDSLERNGYEVSYKFINRSDIGSIQMRKTMALQDSLIIKDTNSGDLYLVKTFTSREGVERKGNLLSILLYLIIGIFVISLMGVLFVKREGLIFLWKFYDLLTDEEKKQLHQKHDRQISFKITRALIDRKKYSE